MSFTSDLEEVKAKIESVLEGAKNAEPSLAELVFRAVEQVFLDAGYTAPTTPEVTPLAEPQA
jgi:hypothetical protein